MSLDFISKILKPKYKIKYVHLKDNSFYFCAKTKKRLDLDSIYMLSRGETWYGKRGFIPFNTDTNTVDVENYANYKLNNKLVNKTNIRKYFEKTVSYKLSHGNILPF
jgi:hypothetical protein